MSERQDDLYEKVRRHVFGPKERKSDLIIRESTDLVKVDDPDVVEWNERQIRKKFGFKPKNDSNKGAYLSLSENDGYY